MKGKVFAPSNHSAQAARIQTWTEVASAAGHSDLFSLDLEIVCDVSAAFWKADFRSVDGYLNVARQEMILRNGTLPASCLIRLKRVARAEASGPGPARHATEVPFIRLAELADSDEPLVTGGPCHLRRLAIIGSWWMLRKIEAANFSLACISISASSASVLLPASKNDTTGRVASRSVG